MDAVTSSGYMLHTSVNKLIKVLSVVVIIGASQIQQLIILNATIFKKVRLSKGRAKGLILDGQTS